jgi:fibro-slime domain-containing protein
MKRLGIWIAAGLLVGCTSGSGSSGGSGGSGSEAGQGGGSDMGGSGGKATGGSGGKATGGSGGKATGGAGGSATVTGGTAAGGTAAGGTGGTAAGGTGGTKATGGTGGTAATGGTGGTAIAGCTELTGTVRDFVSSHADFQYDACPTGVVCNALSAPGMVKAALENGKPKLSTTGEFKDSNGYVQSISSASFDSWWSDSAASKSLQRKWMLEKRSAQLNSFGSEMFYPIDGEGWGNTDYAGTDKPATDLEKTEDDAHNQLFTVEVYAEFLYEKGKNQIFITESDDDSWIFINGKLAVDNGGLHGFAPASASLDPIANDLGLESGKSYPIVMLFADRQLSGAKYRVSTNATFTKCMK